MAHTKQKQTNSNKKAENKQKNSNCLRQFQALLLLQLHAKILKLIMLPFHKKLKEFQT